MSYERMKALMLKMKVQLIFNLFSSLIFYYPVKFDS